MFSYDLLHLKLATWSVWANFYWCWKDTEKAGHWAKKLIYGYRLAINSSADWMRSAKLPIFRWLCRISYWMSAGSAEKYSSIASSNRKRSGMVFTSGTYCVPAGNPYERKFITGRFGLQRGATPDLRDYIPCIRVLPNEAGDPILAPNCVPAR